MEEVVASVFDLMGKTADPQLEEEIIKQRVDAMFRVCFHIFHLTTAKKWSFVNLLVEEGGKIHLFERLFHFLKT